MPDTPATLLPPPAMHAHAASRRSALCIERALHHIHCHLAERLSLQDLATVAGLSLFRFATAFRTRVGLPPHQYICKLRIRHAQQLLRAGLPAASVASETGFCDQSHLQRHFKRVCGMTPGQYVQALRTSTALIA